MRALFIRVSYFDEKKKKEKKLRERLNLLIGRTKDWRAEDKPGGRPVKS